MKRFAGPKLLKVAVAAISVVLATGSASSALDRGELAKVLKTIPPNGPFWRYGNVTMRARARKAGMEPVVFAHWSHRSRYTCRICHLDLGFGMRQGDTGITRSQYLSGKFCGACHNGETAFTVKDGPDAQCGRCHLKNTKELEKDFTSFAESMPIAPFGNGIDWAAALRDGAIKPVDSLEGADPAMPLPAKLKKPLKLGTTSPRSDVAFSHEEHFAELDCSSCHPDIFNIKQKSTAAFSMDANIYNNFCGACHMQVAFPMNDCRRCHLSMSKTDY
jgi:c(7)-type cytochrome triheme protein